jgi:glucose-1-phosphate adenylyltransferase
MKIVALVLAGGEGTRLYPLTAEHAKPALPFAHGYRIVDFVLANLVNSGISTIYVLAQYKPDSLMRHLAGTWASRFEESAGTLKVLLPRSNRQLFRGTADAVHQYLDLIQAHAPDLVAVFAADHVYRMDVRQMVDFHHRARADATVAAIAVPLEQSSSFGIMCAHTDGRVREFQEKPKHAAPIPNQPGRAYASMGNYLFEPQALEEALAAGARRGGTDFGRDILPFMCDSARVYAYDFAHNTVPGVQEFEEPAYWRDVGTLTALAAAQQDVMGQRPRFNLRNRRWPIHELPEREPLANAAWRSAGKDLRSDERLSTS